MLIKNCFGDIAIHCSVLVLSIIAISTSAKTDLDQMVLF